MTAGDTADLTTLLVVNTEMSGLAWSLDKAREYMRENAFISEADMLTEFIRYACDLPAQALRYKFGDCHLQDLRATMHAALGEQFDVRLFHDIVLPTRCLPPRAVADNVANAVSA